MIYVFLASGFEEIEAVTTIDILRRAELDVKVVGIGGKEIRGAHGIKITADIQEFQADPQGVEMIVLPGGMPGTLNLEKSELVQEFIDLCVCNDLWIGAICAAPSILGHKGLTKGRKMVCYPGFESQMDGLVQSEHSVEVDGKFVTGRGPGVSVDFALQLVACLIGDNRAKAVRGSLQCKD